MSILKFVNYFSYPEIGNANFKCTLSTAISLKNMSALWNFYCPIKAKEISGKLHMGDSFGKHV